MGKKYIIELEDENYHQYSDSEPSDYLWRVKGFNALVFDEVGISKLTPYTEPDLEQVRKEAYAEGFKDGQYAKRNGLVAKYAYEEGYKTAKIQCGIQAEKDLREVGKMHYQRGLNDAWEAVRKIIKMPEGDLLNIFTECYSAVCTAPQVILKYDASEAIEKIRQYEQEKEEIKVGDEVTEGNHNACALYENPDGTQVTVLKQDGTTAWWCKSAIHRTGRHFPEIATVLEKMRGEQDG